MKFLVFLRFRSWYTSIRVDLTLRGVKNNYMIHLVKFGFYTGGFGKLILTQSESGQICRYYSATPIKGQRSKNRWKCLRT